SWPRTLPNPVPGLKAPLTVELFDESGDGMDAEAFEGHRLRDDGVRVAETERLEPFEPVARPELARHVRGNGGRLRRRGGRSGRTEDRVEPRPRVLRVHVDRATTERLEADLRAAEPRRQLHAERRVGFHELGEHLREQILLGEDLG